MSARDGHKWAAANLAVTKIGVSALHGSVERSCLISTCNRLESTIDRHVNRCIWDLVWSETYVQTHPER